MSYVLDTNAVIGLLKNTAFIRNRFAAALESENDIRVPSIVLFELWYGVARSARRQDNADALTLLLAPPVEVLDFTREDALIAGDVRASLARAGTPIGPYDLLIAAQAIRTNATLITANTREFGRVEGLRLENWMAD